MDTKKYNKEFTHYANVIAEALTKGDLLTKLMKEKIKQQQKTNVIQSDLFSDMLSKSLSNYLKGLLTNEEVIEELLKMAQQADCGSRPGRRNP